MIDGGLEAILNWCKAGCSNHTRDVARDWHCLTGDGLNFVTGHIWLFSAREAVLIDFFTPASHVSCANIRGQLHTA